MAAVSSPVQLLLLVLRMQIAGHSLTVAGPSDDDYQNWGVSRVVEWGGDEWSDIIVNRRTKNNHQHNFKRDHGQDSFRKGCWSSLLNTTTTRLRTSLCELEHQQYLKLCLVTWQNYPHNMHCSLFCHLLLRRNTKSYSDYNNGKIDCWLWKGLRGRCEEFTLSGRVIVALIYLLCPDCDAWEPALDFSQSIHLIV